MNYNLRIVLYWFEGMLDVILIGKSRLCEVIFVARAFFCNKQLFSDNFSWLWKMGLGWR